MSDLNRFHQRLAPPRLNEIKRFREVGVSPEALSAPELPARADVVFHDDRPLFDFADDAGDGSAVAGFIFPARDDEGEPSLPYLSARGLDPAAFPDLSRAVRFAPRCWHAASKAEGLVR